MVADNTKARRVYGTQVYVKQWEQLVPPNKKFRGVLGKSIKCFGTENG